MTDSTAAQSASPDPEEYDYRLRCALTYVDNGWPVLPVRPGMKRPWLTDWPRSASTDPQTVVAWLTGTNNNYAVACGRAGLLVIDEDDPGALARLAQGRPVPDTYTVATAHDHRHFYFLQPDEPIGCPKGPPGIDVKGVGGCALGPGSVAEGGGYVVLVGVEPAPCPEWLAAELRGAATASPPRDGKQQHPWDEPVVERRLTDPAPIGERHDRGRDLAYLLRQSGLPWDAARLAMEAWFWHVEQSPENRFPWSDAETSLRTAYDKPLESAVEDEPDEPPPPLWEDVARLLATGPIEPPKPSHLARADGECLLYEKRVNVLFGDSETGKTWVALATTAEALLDGGSAWVIDVDHNTVEAIVEHLRAFGVLPEVLGDPERFRYSAPEDGAGLRAVVEEARRWAPTVVVLDSVGEVMAMLGLNSNSPDDYTTAHRQAMRRISVKGPCVIAVDHLPKSVETAALGATGTGAKKRVVGGVSLRVTIAETFAPGQGGACHLSVHKDRHGGVRAHAAPGKPEQLAGTFRLTEEDGALSWCITKPDATTAAKVSAKVGGLTEDVEALALLMPPPNSKRDVQVRQGWGWSRASRAYDAWLAGKGAATASDPRGEKQQQHQTESPSPSCARAREGLACQVCGTTENVIEWGEPFWVVRCKAHNPLTYHEEES